MEYNQTIAYALHRFLEAQVRSGTQVDPRDRLFFRLDGFDDAAYTGLLDFVRSNSGILGGRPVTVRTTGALPDFAEFSLEPHKTATSYRNSLLPGQALVLLFNQITSDAQSLKDIFPITESRLASDGLSYLIEAAFRGGYSLNRVQVDTLINFIARYRKVIEPQLRDLASFLAAVNELLAAHQAMTMEEAVAEALPYLRLFRCQELAQYLSTPRGDRLLRDLYWAARLGDQLLGKPTLDDYLKRLKEATFDDDVPSGGLGPEEKREVLRRFLAEIGSDNRALRIDWDEVKPVLFRKARRSQAQRLQELARAIEDALDRQKVKAEDLPDYAQEALNDLKQGGQPAAEVLDRLTIEYRETLGQSVAKKLRRLVGIRPQQVTDFLVGLTALALELLSMNREDLEPGCTLRLTVAPGQFDDKQSDMAEALAAFRALYGGVEALVPAVQWNLGDLWAAVRDAEGIEIQEEPRTRKKVDVTSIRFQLTLCDPNSSDLARADLEWQYPHDSPAAAILAELTVLAQKMAARPFIPLYNRYQPPLKVSDIDLRRPLASFGRWFDEPGDLRAAFDEAMTGRLGVRPEPASTVRNAIDALATSFSAFVQRAVRDGLLNTGVDDLLSAYDDLLRTAAERLTRSQEAASGFRVLTQAWIIGSEPFVDWAAVPLIHPLKLLWWRNRARRFNDLIAAMLDPQSNATLVDEARFRRELAQAYSSAGFPVILTLPGRDGPAYFVPLEELQGYELYRPIAAAAAALGLDAEMVSEEEAVAAADITAQYLAQVVEDYIETYPFVEEGLEIYLVKCRNGALPGLLVEQLKSVEERRKWQVRLAITVHTQDRGAPVFWRITDWLAAREDLQGRPAGSYFPYLTLKVLECSYDELFRQVGDKDLVILADVLGERGQRVEGKLDPNPLADAPAEDLLPLYLRRLTPFERGELTRRRLVNPGQQLAVVRHFYNAQYVAHEREPVGANTAIRFDQVISLADWERLLVQLHDAFNWVVCYDPAVDRYLLEDSFPGTVQVIRYSLGLGVKRRHNLTVSSSARTRQFVERRLTARLPEILPGIHEEFRRAIAEQLVEEARAISGNIVLRAAGPGAFLNELIGLVLAKHLTERRYRDVHPGALTAWIYLDDFAHWFDGKRRPDMAFIAIPPEANGGLPLHIEIIEAKCVGDANFADEAVDAERQVAQGVSRLALTWAPKPTAGLGHLDAPYWYDQLHQAIAANLAIEDEGLRLWQVLDDRLMAGDFNLEMSGHAWVFCYDGQGTVPTGSPFNEGGSELSASDADDCPIYYHRYARVALRRALRELVEAWRIPAPAETWNTAHDAPPMSEGEPSELIQVLETGQAPEISPAEHRAPSDELQPTAVGSILSSESVDLIEPSSVGVEPKILPSTLGHDWLVQRARDLDRTLHQYGIHAYPVDPTIVDLGPSIIRFKVRLRPGEKLTRLQAMAVDLARELALDSVPLIDNVPGTQYVGVDLPRPERVVIPLLPALVHLPRASIATLPFLVGQTPDGRTVVHDLSQLPHLLVAGTTGSGKTMFLYGVLVSLLHQFGPESLSMLVVDPKQTDLVFFEGLPHLYDGRVFTDPEEAITELQALTGEELEKRTSLLRTARCRDLIEYNSRYPHAPLGHIVVAIDEYADLVQVMDRNQQQTFEREIIRLAQRARNVGIHLVISTQRPSADIVTPRLKAVLPCRISFRLPSLHDSRTILDRPGAENLLGKGDMLFLADGQVKRLQGFYVTSGELSVFLKGRHL